MKQQFFLITPLSHSIFPCSNSASTIVLIWFTNEDQDSVHYSCKVIWKLQWRVSNPRYSRTASRQKIEKTQILLISPTIIFCPTASAAKRAEQISPGSAELSVLPSLSCQRPPTRQVPDDWLAAEADEWRNRWLASAPTPPSRWIFPTVLPQCVNCLNGWNSWARQTRRDSGAVESELEPSLLGVRLDANV